MTDGSNIMNEILLDVVPHEDTPQISNIITPKAGAYPLDAKWSESKSVWLNTLKERETPVCEANTQIHEHFAEKYGPASDIAMATGILVDIYPALTKIAIAQFEQGYNKGPRSWNEVDSKDSDALGETVDKILADHNNDAFFAANSSFRKGLELIKNVLITSNNPGEIYTKHSEYMKGCIEANARGEVILYIPFESDFTNPVEREDQETQICEAMASVMVPMGRNERDEFDKLTKTTWELLKERGNPHQVNSNINIIAGYNVMGAGFEILESTTGEAFVLKHNGSHEHGFYLALNNIDKKKDFWRVVSDNTTNFYKVMTLLDVVHEQSHRLYPEHGELGEVPADIPAVILTLKLADNLHIDKVDVIKGILTEYVSEIVNSVSEKDWFSGYKPDQENPLYAGYLLSGVLIANAVTASGVVRMENGELYFDASQNTIDELIRRLEEIDVKFHEKDPKTLEVIRLAVTNIETSKIVDYYRDRVKH